MILLIRCIYQHQMFRSLCSILNPSASLFADSRKGKSFPFLSKHLMWTNLKIIEVIRVAKLLLTNTSRYLGEATLIYRVDFFEYRLRHLLSETFSRVRDSRING
jgi:hypothetical protein